MGKRTEDRSGGGRKGSGGRGGGGRMDGLSPRQQRATERHVQDVSVELFQVVRGQRNKSVVAVGDVGDMDVVAKGIIYRNG